MAMRHAPAGGSPAVGADEVEVLVRAYHAEHRQADLDRIVEINEGSVRALASRTRWHNDSLDDLVQVATEGLLAAIDRFDPDRGVAFHTYAEATIVGVLRHHHRTVLHLRVPRGLQDLNHSCHRVAEHLAAGLKRMPTSAEIAAEIGVDAAEVVAALAVDELFHPVSLSDSTAADRDPSAWECLGRVDSMLEATDERADMRAALAVLPDRLRTIIVLHFYEGWTQSEIGAHLGISQVQVSRLMTRSLLTMREHADSMTSPRIA